MNTPRLIGIITLKMPRVLPGKELFAEIGVADDGQLWALIVRREPVDDTKIVRLFYDRWVRMEAIPFDHEAVITKDIKNVGP